MMGEQASGVELTAGLVCLLGCPGLLSLLKPLLALVDLGVGVVVVELCLERLAVDEAVDDSKGERRVPRDLKPSRANRTTDKSTKDGSERAERGSAKDQTRRIESPDGLDTRRARVLGSGCGGCWG